MYSKNMPEDNRWYRRVETLNPQSLTLITVIRLREYDQSNASLTETEGRELPRKVSAFHEESSESETIPDKLDEDNAYIDSKDHWGSFTCVINDLLEEIRCLDNALEYNKQRNGDISAIQFVDNATANIRCITKDSKKGHYRRRTMGRKFQYCRITIYENRFNYLDGVRLNTVIFYRVTICFHTKIVLTEVDIIVIDFKLHVHHFVQDVRKGVHTICGNKQDDPPTVEPQEQNMSCAHLKKESNVDDVEKMKYVKLSVTQKHGQIVKDGIDGKNVKPSNDRLSVRFKKKTHCWLFWLLHFFILVGVNAQQIEVKDLLTTKTCSQNNFYSLKQLCHTDEISHNMTVDNCNFNEVCGTDENPVCLNTEKMGVYVCLRKGLTCRKGRIIVAWQDIKFPDRVYVQEIDCSNGTFQPTESDCIHACLFTHRNLSDMSDRYTVSSVGDNVNPTKVFCNFKKGYFNPERKSILNYDQDEIFTPDFCTKAVDGNPCTKGKFPLPDGLCVSECELGFERNPPSFLCRQSSADKTTKVLPVSTTILSTTRLHSPITTKNVATVTITPKTPKQYEEKDETFPWWGYLLLGTGGGLVLAFLTVGLFVRWRRGKRCRAIKRPENEGLLSKGCDNDVAKSKTKQLKEISKTATTTVHKTSYNFYGDSAHVNINDDRLSEIQDKLFTLTDCKAIKEEEDTLHEVIVHESNDSTISPAKAITY